MGSHFNLAVGTAKHMLNFPKESLDINYENE